MKAILTLLLIAMSFSAHTEDLISIFRQGNAHYSKGEYQPALEKYKQIEKQGYVSAELFYNMGNAYYKLDSVAASILYFERAKKLEPSDEDIQYNLEAANQRTVDKIDKMPVLFIKDWWQRFTSVLTVEGWSFLLITGCWLFFVATAIYLVNRSRGSRITFFTTASFALVFTVIVLFISITAWRREVSEREGIIFTPSITVKSAPASGKELFVLHEGTKVRIVEYSDGWIKIKIGNGNVGWLPENSLEPI